MHARFFLSILFFFVFIGVAFAATQNLTVESCVIITAPGTIANCQGLNQSDDNIDVTLSKNSRLGTTISDTSFTGTINTVKLIFRHGGQTGISGNAAVRFYDTVNQIDFCTKNVSITNSALFKTSQVTACTPSGGWTPTKVNNLQVILRNEDTGSPQDMYISYVIVTIDYTASPPPAICGNNVAEESEVCDGTALAGESCTTQGYDTGTLTCNASCNGYITTQCSNYVCGNNIKEGNEVCDGTALNNQSCQTQGYDTGTLSCANDCAGYDIAQCSNYVCGNGVVEGTEACDGASLNGQTCELQGFDSGTLSCANDCTSFETTQCTTNEVCGNDIIAGPEVCEGSNVNGQTCQTQGYDIGSLACASDCLSFETSQCSNYICGNNVKEGNEVCDGTALNSQSCQTQGYDTGTLSCANDCTGYDTTQCTAFVCGNGIKEGSEICDSVELNGQSCQTQGYDTGTLSCASDCASFETTECSNYICGNEIIEGNEVCDGSELEGESCTTQGYDTGMLACANDCLSFETAQCTAFVCGNGIKEGSEVCDSSDLSGESCQSQGYTSGALLCASDCTSFDAGQCFVATCGNGIKEIGETCDGNDFDNHSCQTEGYDAGNLSCAQDCSAFLVNECTTSEICGNNEIAGPEMCDGTNVAEETCQDLGYASGTLSCASDCLSFDRTQCNELVSITALLQQSGSGTGNNTTTTTTKKTVCGNNIREGLESCDGSQLNNKRCEDFNLVSGTLSCTAKCAFNISECISPKTGEVITPEEEQEIIEESEIIENELEPHSENNTVINNTPMISADNKSPRAQVNAKSNDESILIFTFAIAIGMLLIIPFWKHNFK